MGDGSIRIGFGKRLNGNTNALAARAIYAGIWAMEHSYPENDLSALIRPRESMEYD